MDSQPAFEGLTVDEAAGSRPDPDGFSTYTVGSLNQAVAAALVEAFPRQVWVRGEIQQLRRSANGHAYFQLVEKDGERDHVRAVLPVALFKADRPGVNRALREVPGVRITDGVEVRIRGRVDYWPPAGRLQLVMSGIDPVFTVGRLAADRERVLRVLAQEGLLRANATRELAPVPLRIGLVTSGGSAAYHDFVHELERSRHAFRVAHVDVRVQGAGAWRRVAYGLGRLGDLELDVVAVIRGGGARSDLAAFDAEGVARAIALMPVPVVTGIGHEVDRTVADEVAHTVAKTPTAAAAWLVDAVDAYCDRLGRLAHRVALRSRSACTAAGREVAQIERRVRRELPVALGREHRLLDDLGRRAAEVGRSRSAEAGRALSARHDELVSSARRVLRDRPRRLDGLEARVRALDPHRVLERGYSITRTTDGRVLRGVAELAADQELRVELADGTVHTRVRRWTSGPQRSEEDGE